MTNEVSTDVFFNNFEDANNCIREFEDSTNSRFVVVQKKDMGRLNDIGIITTVTY